MLLRLLALLSEGLWKKMLLSFACNSFLIWWVHSVFSFGTIKYLTGLTGPLLTHITVIDVTLISFYAMK